MTPETAQSLAERGWARLPTERLAWVGAARLAGRRALEDPEMRRQWLQCGGTWFVGVDALPSTASGAVDGVPLDPLLRDLLAAHAPLHRAQLSVIFPGYPRRRGSESDAAFRYRRNRDAAHVDGITAEAPARRRVVTEPHALILGLPLNETDPAASPLVVWEGSHTVLRAALAAAFARHPRADWPALDVTEIYTATRRHCFDQCPRVPLSARPGEALLLHRHLLHGIAPWPDALAGPEDGRMMAYFRPVLAGGLPDWLQV
jgi:hypothetical protein